MCILFSVPVGAWRQIDHTADLALEVKGASESAVLETAALALVEIMTERSRIEGAAVRSVSLSTLDPEDRLVQFLNEIIVLAVTDGFLMSAATIELTETGLQASLQGEEDAQDKLRGELKAATYHDLMLEERAEGWFARVVIDV